MTVALLATKYHRPLPAPDLVPRPRLIHLLNGNRRLTLLSAPAGFGKTALVSHWLTRIENGESRIERAGQRTDHASFSILNSPPKVAWLTLDQGDNTLAGFWGYVIAALQTAAPQVGLVAQTALQAPQPPPITAVLTALINDLADLAHPLTLVLDDYHLVTLPAIHQSLDYLIEHLPPPLRLVIATREDPPLALSRLRARGQLSEIRADQLRFSAAEAGALLNDVRALELGLQDIARLTERTEGWAAGLCLAALSLEQAGDRTAFIADFSASHRFVVDYLADEVLARLDPATQRFLRRTAILRRLCAPLCDAILDEEGDTFVRRPSSVVLSELERANLFLIPLDTERHWYRYHNLFGELLRMHLSTSEPELAPELYRRAIAWCRSAGLPREALGYALDARAYEQAAELVESLAAEVLSHEGPEPVLAWVAALPAPLVQRRPLLGCAYAWALTVAGRMAEADAYLGAAEAAIGAAGEPAQPHVRAQVAAHRAYLRFFSGAFAEAQALAQEALAGLPAGDLALRTRTALVLSSVLRFAGRLQAAEAILLPMADAVQATRNVYTTTLYYSSLGQLRREQGRLRQTLNTYRQALAAAERQTGHADGPFTGFAHIAIGHVLREWNDLDAAAEATLKGIALCRRWQQIDVLAIGLIELAALHQDRGEDALAQGALDELRQIVATMASPWAEATVATFQARLDLVRGDVAAASRWAQASGLTVEPAPSLDRIDEYETLAQVLVLRGDLVSAQRLLEQLASALRASARVERLLAVLIWLARAQAGQGQDTKAAVALDEALSLGEPEGYVRTFLAGGAPVAALLRRMRDEGGGRQPYIARLLAAFASDQATPAAPDLQPSAPSPQPLPEPLGERELDILRLMAAGLTNPEIGEQLFLSANTVRWYASQIFAKLGVGGRRAAVARARELGLV